MGGGHAYRECYVCMCMSHGSHKHVATFHSMPACSLISPHHPSVVDAPFAPVDNVIIMVHMK